MVGTPSCLAEGAEKPSGGRIAERGISAFPKVNDACSIPARDIRDKRFGAMCKNTLPADGGN